jgi:hypothetical protein
MTTSFRTNLDYSENFESSRASEIKNFCQERQIKTLIHFTHTSNLLSIFRRGLLSRSSISNKGLHSAYNDALRLDGYKEAICLSIEFPNYKMFYKISKNNPQNYAVLVLNSSILWELNCAFCRDNAASNHVRSIPLETRSNSNSLKELYMDYGTFRRNDLRIPDSNPTNPQAEILVFDHIAPQYINSVHFNTLTAAQKAQDYLYNQKIDNDIPQFYYSDQYFKSRSDWMKW